MIETTCTRCRQPFSPTRDDIRAGTWQTCPPCRAGPGMSLFSTTTACQHDRTGDRSATTTANERRHSRSRIDRTHAPEARTTLPAVAIRTNTERT
jgi:hypothetical protein